MTIPVLLLILCLSIWGCSKEEPEAVAVPGTVIEEVAAEEPVTQEPVEEDYPAAQRIGQVRENIERYICSHYTSELSMQDVAKAMNYSEAYFCKLFKQCFKVNFSAWLNEFRVEKAKEMLLHTRMSIREISLACGYTDANYFARVFKRITGKTPSEYRMT